MALSELAEIRALLIAQTETAEPRRATGLLGVVGSLLKPRGEPPAPARPLNLGTPPRRFTERATPDDAMLLLGEEIDPDIFAPLDLPPPPRAEFGVRSPRPYLPHDSVLLLNKRVQTPPRRLTLLTETGEAVGEVYLTPQDAPARAVYNAAYLGEEHQAPYFPGDLDEHEPAALQPLAEPASPISAGPSPGRNSLGRDLLNALALTLSREHEVLSDRLLRTERTGVSP